MQKEKQIKKQYSQEFKEEAVALVVEQGYSVIKVAESLGIRPNIIYRRKQQLESDKPLTGLLGDEQTELT